MSKSNKNQKSITSFFKNPGQSTSNNPSSSKSKPSPTIEIKKEIEETISKSPSSLPPSVHSPKKPSIISSPTVINERQPTHETEWINLSDRFLLTNRQFDVQYAHLYAERLGIMRQMVTKAAENRWGLFIQLLNKIILLIFNRF
jgi:hypothetical protein